MPDKWAEQTRKHAERFINTMSSTPDVLASARYFHGQRPPRAVIPAPAPETSRRSQDLRHPSRVPSVASSPRPSRVPSVTSGPRSPRARSAAGGSQSPRGVRSPPPAPVKTEVRIKEVGETVSETTEEKWEEQTRKHAERFINTMSSTPGVLASARYFHGKSPPPHLPAPAHPTPHHPRDLRRPSPREVYRGVKPVKYERRIPGERIWKEEKLHAEEEYDYDPYENRVVNHPTTNTETLLHLLKGSLGTGILAMPHAFTESGYVVGVIGVAIIGIMCTYCIHILLDSCYVLCKRLRVPSLTYTATAEAALLEGPGWCQVCAPFAKHIVNAFLLIYQIGIGCVYVVFVAENLHCVLTYFDIVIKPVHIMIILLLPLILINCVRDLKYLAPFSAIANAVTIVSFGIILYYIFREPIIFEGKSAGGIFTKYPLFFGTVLFALEAIGVILPLENEMKTPRDFSKPAGVLNQAMTLIIFLYFGMGLFGYLRYGDEVLGSITLNLPAEVEFLAVVTQFLLAAAIFVTHALACYVAIDILWVEYIRPCVDTSKYRYFWEYLMRVCIVFVTFALAAAVPELDLFISLFGALCLSALGLAFPAVIESCTYWHYVSREKRKKMLIKNIFIFVFGILGLVVGTYSALSGIIKKFTK